MDDLNVLYQNLKNKQFYQIIGESINRTNGSDDELMVIYVPIKSDLPIHQKLQCRNKSEFLEKFIKVEYSNTHDLSYFFMHRDLVEYNEFDAAYFENDIKTQFLSALNYVAQDRRKVVEITINAANVRWSIEDTLLFLVKLILSELNKENNKVRTLGKFLLEKYQQLYNLEFNVKNYPDAFHSIDFQDLLKTKLPRLNPKYGIGSHDTWNILNPEILSERYFFTLDLDSLDLDSIHPINFF